MDNTSHTIAALCEFLKVELPSLPQRYSWRIPLIPGFARSGESTFEANIELKNYLHDRWVAAADASEQIELATLVIRDWGGVKRNKPETLSKYVDWINQTTPPTPLQGVASYSKLYSISRPADYAIYDARVAACLNAIQINAGVERGLAFNYVAGRNNVIGNASKKIGFAHDPRFSIRALQQRGWARITRSKAYATYIDVLKGCQERLRLPRMTEIEMALFSQAEAQCLLALKYEGSSKDAPPN